MWNRTTFSGSWSRVLVCLCFLLLQSVPQSHAFVLLTTQCPPPPLVAPPRAVPPSIRHAAVSSSSSRKSTIVSLSMLPTLLTTTNPMWMAMEVFDGSSIVDPVVVSDVFWTSLKGKLIAVVIGQLLATVAFGALSWLVTSQLSRLGTSLLSTNTLNNKTNNNNNNSRTFQKATDIPGFANPTTGASQKQIITPDFGKLIICLMIDVVGSSSEVIPILGELTDVVYAPIAATVLRNLYGSNNILFGLEFVEEILPFTDILPLATIW